MNCKKLRRDIIDYYGTAMFRGSPMAMMDISRVERMSDGELLEEAKKIGLKLSKYEIN